MDRWVEIEFDCLPLRSVGRLDIPMDASPKYRQHCERVKAAMERHGCHNTYYLYNARCVFHLTNDRSLGQLNFAFHGTVFTAEDDRHTRGCELEVELHAETCDWLTGSITEWFRETVHRSVFVEFDRYIAAGDLRQTEERIARLQALNEESQGFLGMHL